MGEIKRVFRYPVIISELAFGCQLEILDFPYEKNFHYSIEKALTSARNIIWKHLYEAILRGETIPSPTIPRNINASKKDLLIYLTVEVEIVDDKYHDNLS